MPKFKKDPAAILDYKFDLAVLTHLVEGAESDYLQTGETISSTPGDVDVFTSNEDELIVDSFELTDTNTSVTAWISGGLKGKSYTLTCRFTTSLGRTDDRSATIVCVER